MTSNGQFSDADSDGEQSPNNTDLPQLTSVSFNNQNLDSNQAECSMSDHEMSDEDSTEMWDDSYEYYYDAFDVDCGSANAGHITNRLNDARAGRPRSNVNPSSSSVMQPKTKVLEKYNAKIVLDKFVGLRNCSDAVTNSLSRHETKDDNKITRRDKKDRATVENALDPKTLNCLHRIMKRYKLTEVNGCIGTGKEANVYHAVDIENKEFAIKIYKTACITFKNRRKYMEGNHSCKHANVKPKSSRKMVYDWSSKECRNLISLKKCTGFNSPTVIALLKNVLIMDFIGEDGYAAPKLKDVELTTQRACEVYIELIKAIRTIYRDCKLVHADLSEFNILYFDDKPYIIDVSQAVETGHPMANEFLLSDLSVISKFFAKQLVPTIPLSRLVPFVISDKLKIADIDGYIDKMMNYDGPEPEIDDETFRKLHIPRTLNEVTTFETDLEEISQNKKTMEDLPYNDLLADCRIQAELRLTLDKLEFIQDIQSPSKDVEDAEPIEDIQSPSKDEDAEPTADIQSPNIDEDQEEPNEDVQSPNINEDEQTISLENESESETKVNIDKKLNPSTTPGRPKNETAEEKIARLHAVKDDKAKRRLTKMNKNTKKCLEKKSKNHGSKKKHH